MDTTGARHLQGRLVGQMEALGFPAQEEAVLRTLTEDVLKSSEIESGKLDAGQVRSSVARRLGIDIGGLQPADPHVVGVVEMMLDATQHYDHVANCGPVARHERRSSRSTTLPRTASEIARRESAAIEPFRPAPPLCY